jgi:hypothetical protein
MDSCGQQSAYTAAEAMAGMIVWETILGWDERFQKGIAITPEVDAWIKEMNVSWEGAGVAEMRDEATRLGCWVEKIYNFLPDGYLDERCEAYDFDFIPAMLLKATWGRSPHVGDYTYVTKPTAIEVARELKA